MTIQEIEEFWAPIHVLEEGKEIREAVESTTASRVLWAASQIIGLSDVNYMFFLSLITDSLEEAETLDEKINTPSLLSEYLHKRITQDE
jgi:hypothetical protein